MAKSPASRHDSTDSWTKPPPECAVMDGKCDIMISFNNDSAGEDAEHLTRFLQQHTLKVFCTRVWCPEHLGLNWRTATAVGAEHCRVFVMLMTKGWLHSGECKMETEIVIRRKALDQNSVLMIPVQYDSLPEEDPSGFLKWFESLQWVKHEADSWMEQILQACRNQTGDHQTHDHRGSSPNHALKLLHARDSFNYELMMECLCDDSEQLLEEACKDLEASGGHDRLLALLQHDAQGQIPLLEDARHMVAALRSREATRVVAVGEMGAGKSTLLSALTGSASKDSALFNIGNSVESVTNTTTFRAVPWAQDPRSAEPVNEGIVCAIDTPGLGDIPTRDSANMTKLAKALRELGSVHMIMIVINSANPRLSQTTRQLLEVLTNFFGEASVWDHVAMVFTRWKKDAKTERLRSKGKEKTEDQHKKEMWAVLCNQIPRLDGRAPVPMFFIDAEAYLNRNESDEDFKPEATELEAAVDAITHLSIIAGGMGILHTKQATAETFRPTLHMYESRCAGGYEVGRELCLAPKPEAQAGMHWSVQPALPEGLSLDGLTGKITGTPLAPSEDSYVVTVSNSEDSAVNTSVTLTLAVFMPEEQLEGLLRAAKERLDCSLMLESDDEFNKACKATREDLAAAVRQAPKQQIQAAKDAFRHEQLGLWQHRQMINLCNLQERLNTLTATHGQRYQELEKSMQELERVLLQSAGTADAGTMDKAFSKYGELKQQVEQLESKFNTNYELDQALTMAMNELSMTEPDSRQREQRLRASIQQAMERGVPEAKLHECNKELRRVQQENEKAEVVARCERAMKERAIDKRQQRLREPLQQARELGVPAEILRPFESELEGLNSWLAALRAVADACQQPEGQGRQLQQRLREAAALELGPMAAALVSCHQALDTRGLPERHAALRAAVAKAEEVQLPACELWHFQCKLSELSPLVALLQDCVDAAGKGGDLRVQFVQLQRAVSKAVEAGVPRAELSGHVAQAMKLEGVVRAVDHCAEAMSMRAAVRDRLAALDAGLQEAERLGYQGSTIKVFEQKREKLVEQLKLLQLVDVARKEPSLLRRQRAMQSAVVAAEHADVPAAELKEAHDELQRLQQLGNAASSCKDACQASSLEKAETQLRTAVDKANISIRKASGFSSEELSNFKAEAVEPFNDALLMLKPMVKALHACADAKRAQTARLRYEQLEKALAELEKLQRRQKGIMFSPGRVSPEASLHSVKSHYMKLLSEAATQLEEDHNKLGLQVRAWGMCEQASGMLFGRCSSKRRGHCPLREGREDLEKAMSLALLHGMPEAELACFKDIAHQLLRLEDAVLGNGGCVEVAQSLSKERVMEAPEVKARLLHAALARAMDYKKTFEVTVSKYSASKDMREAAVPVVDECLQMYMTFHRQAEAVAACQFAWESRADPQRARKLKDSLSAAGQVCSAEQLRPFRSMLELLDAIASQEETLPVREKRLASAVAGLREGASPRDLAEAERLLERLRSQRAALEAAVEEGRKVQQVPVVCRAAPERAPEMSCSHLTAVAKLKAALSRATALRVPQPELQGPLADLEEQQGLGMDMGRCVQAAQLPGLEERSQALSEALRKLSSKYLSKKATMQFSVMSQYCKEQELQLRVLSDCQEHWVTFHRSLDIDSLARQLRNTLRELNNLEHIAAEPQKFAALLHMLSVFLNAQQEIQHQDETRTASKRYAEARAQLLSAGVPREALERNYSIPFQPNLPFQPRPRLRR